MANHTQQNFYTNPAFCQQSEYYAVDHRRALSPVRSEKSARQSPLGAQTPVHILDTSIHSVRDEPLPPRPKRLEDHDEYEQEFYEEMLVDDTGYIQEKKLLVIASPHKETAKAYIKSENNDSSQPRTGSRYAPVALEQNYSKNKARYEYIPVQREEHLKGPQETVTPSGRIHRYALISNEEELERPPPQTNGGRYALVPLEEIQNKNRYAIISDTDSRYEYIKEDKSPPRQTINRMVQRKESYRQSNYEQSNQRQQHYRQENYQQSHSYQEQNYNQPYEKIKKGNPLATQKLHELLQTPKKTTRQLQQNTPRQLMSPHSPRKVQQISPNIIIPKGTPRKGINPKIQQKLNYNMPPEKQHTAIVAPMCSSSIQSVYSDTTISKSESWMNLSMKKSGVQGTLAVAAVMMLLCGGVTTSLCFYMIYVMGKLYFLEFGIVSGFICFILGILGFRTRNCYWLPNRNYISGYIVLSIFSLITCGVLLVMLIMKPKQGTPLADMTSGAVCGISALSIILAFGGIVASYCCKYPPPDNRVQHCARGFTV